MPEIGADRLSRIRGGLGQAAFDGAVYGVEAAGNTVGDVGLGLIGAITGDVPTIARYDVQASPAAMPTALEVAAMPAVDAQQLQLLMARQMPPSPQAAWLN
jgi:hypothetical protein